jgi:excisionase family DNA binding protein
VIRSRALPGLRLFLQRICEQIKFLAIRGMEPNLALPMADNQLCHLPVTLDAGQCAQLLRCAKTTVEELCERGELPATKFGRGWIFVSSQIIEYLRARCEGEAKARRSGCSAQPESAVLQYFSGVAKPKGPGRPRKRIPQLPSPPESS